MCTELLSETCHDVCGEPALQPLSGEQLSTASAATGNDAHRDIVASGLWGDRLERTFLM